MRLLQSWWQTLVISSQANPPRFVELVMLLLALLLLAIWGVIEEWPYLVLSLSYGVGAATSILVREMIHPSPTPRANQIAALILLAISLIGFVDLTYYL